MHCHADGVHPEPTLRLSTSTPPFHMQSAYWRSEEKRLTGWKQGHTPAFVLKPLPSAGVSFWEIALESCEFLALRKEQPTRRTRGKVHKPRRIDNKANPIQHSNIKANSCKKITQSSGFNSAQARLEPIQLDQAQTLRISIFDQTSN